MPDFTDEHWSVGSLSVVDEIKNTPTKKPTYVCIDKEYYKQQIDLLKKYETEHQKYKLQEKIIAELKS